MTNTPKTVDEAILLIGTTWTLDGKVREITRVENVAVSQYDHRTVMADIYWRTSNGKERANPTPLTTFRTWLNKATAVT